MKKKKTLGPPKREIVWLSQGETVHTRRAPECGGGTDTTRFDGETILREGRAFPDDADCPSAYSYPGPRVLTAPTPPGRTKKAHRAAVLKVLGLGLIWMRNFAANPA